MATLETTATASSDIFKNFAPALDLDELWLLISAGLIFCMLYLSESKYGNIVFMCGIITQLCN